MVDTQSPERNSWRKNIAERVDGSGLPGIVTILILKTLGYERPELNKYYPEIDRKIQEFLQKQLNEAGYSHVTAQSLARGKFPADYQYVYELVPREKDPEWAERYLPNVQRALHRRLAANTELDFYLGIGVVYAKPKNNRMHVKKAIEWGQKYT